MFEEYYGLERRPFSKTPDPKFLYLSRVHEEALARLQYAVEEREIVMLTGDIGCGKTMLTRALMDSLDENHRVILIINPRLTPTQFLRTVAERFGIENPPKYRGPLLGTVHEQVYKYYEEGVTPVIIIDEAQLVPGKETFEEIRLLTNFQLDDTNLLSLVLVGQTDLRRKLKRRYYEPLMQRVGLFFHLGPLSKEEVKGYVEHRLSVAGRKEPLFTDGAIASICQYSGGVPRVINNLATSALLEGLGAERDVIDSSLVESSSSELGLVALRA